MKESSNQHLPLTEEQKALVEELFAENEAAIKHIIRKTLGDVYKYLNEDCISELCLLTCEKISDIEAHPNPKAWILASAKLTAFTVIHRDKHCSKRLSAKKERGVKTDPTFENALYNLWMKNATPQKLIGTLTKREKEIYQKIYLENKTAEATAEELGIASSTVRSIKKALTDKILEHIQKNI